MVHAPKAYPVYDESYEGALAEIRPHLDSFKNLLTIGRNGTHTYNNMDHSMVTAMLAVRKMLGAEHDLWNLDGKDEYLEEIQEGGEAATIDLSAVGRNATSRARPGVSAAGSPVD